MQPEVLSFDATGEAFALTVLLMMGLVFVIRTASLLGIWHWPKLGNIVASWFKTKRLSHGVASSSEKESPEVHIPTEPWYTVA